MKIISHRGNLIGSEPEFENKLSRIDECIEKGFDVEIDLRCTEDGLLFLGHDNLQYKMSFIELRLRADNLWIHCKDHFALEYMEKTEPGVFNYFWHQKDDYTLTSKGFLWAYPGQEPRGKKCVMVLPEMFYENIEKKECYGICTDYALNYKKT